MFLNSRKKLTREIPAYERTTDITPVKFIAAVPTGVPSVNSAITDAIKYTIAPALLTLKPLKSPIKETSFDADFCAVLRTANETAEEKRNQTAIAAGIYENTASAMVDMEYKYMPSFSSACAPTAASRTDST